MNKHDKSILIGLTLGDGYISEKKDKRYNHTQYGINIIHCEKQKEYIEYKAKLLHSIFGGKEVKVHFFMNNNYPVYRLSKSNKYFKILRRLIYPNGKKMITKNVLKYLTPESIALWYMDDGSLSKKKRNGKVHSYELFLNTYSTDLEHDDIIEYFYNVWNIKFSKVKSKGGYRLRCGTIEARKFINIIDKYIIPSMKYKTDISKKDV